jgi:hypothetical protein
MTDRVVAPLREIRRPLHAGMVRLQEAAMAVQSGDVKGTMAALEKAMAYLRDDFLPYSRSEQVTLFPAVDGVSGSTSASAIMVAQHQSLAAMAEDLDQVVGAACKAEDASAYSQYLLPLLYGLYAAIRVHLEAEDDFYLTLLDEHLSESQVGVIVDNMARVAAGSSAPQR